ncbi:SLAM family member 9-like [Carassius gibelio]|uniref:SLAM family member 9-like n=1 Tax=Carassius gibelio TaxID=101364 RepID=UPI0022791BF3|nr:SLAM family member 9-like [Carassius gibelio]
MIQMLIFFCLSCCHLIGVFGSETNETQSVMEGDSVTLHTDVTEIHEKDTIMWKFGAEKSLIAQIKSTSEIFPTFPDGRFRNRLNLDRQTGSLTITNITTQHAGLYEVETILAKVSSKTFSVSVFARLPVPVISSNSSQCSSSSSSSQQNCSLLCSVVNVGHVTLSWYKGNSLLSSISVSDLSISLSLPLEVEYQEKNSYSCVINNPTTNQTTHLDISKLCHTCSGVSVSLIVLISSAAGSLLIVAALGIFCFFRKNSKTNQEDETREEQITYAEPTFYKRNKIQQEDHVEYGTITMR